jgi:HlyD family secretion protein
LHLPWPLLLRGTEAGILAVVGQPAQEFAMKQLPFLLLFVLLPAGLAFADEPARGSAKPVYRTERVTRGTVVAIVGATGTVQPADVIGVGAQVTGRVVKFGADPKDPKKTVDYGTQVEEGTVLAQLDPARYEARVAKAKADLDRTRAELLLAEARLKQAERDGQRAQKLLERKSISQEEYDGIQGALEVAKASVAVSKTGIIQAEADLRAAQINLDYTTIKSPARGVIIDRRVNLGQTVAASQSAPSLFLIGKDLKRLQVWAAVNEADIGQVQKGQAARFSVAAFPDETFTGVVGTIRLNGAMTQNAVTYTVEVDVDNADGRLLPYLTAQTQIVVATRKDVLLVPNAALRWRPQPEQVTADARAALGTAGGKLHVWVEDKGHVRPIAVKTGITDGVVTEVLRGDLEEGTAVIVADRMPLVGQPKEGRRPLKEGETR